MADLTRLWRPGYLAEEQVHLRGRGTTAIRRLAGPPGAPTIVLLHGLTATASVNWNVVMEPLSRYFQVVAMDVRGHGQGIRLGPGETFRLEDCADDVVALLDHLGVKKAIVGGYSMGGPITQLTWLRHPNRVAGMVLAATAADFAQARTANAALMVLDYSLRKVPHQLRRTALPFADRGVYKHLPLLEQVARDNPLALTEATRALGRYDARVELRRVNIPTSVVLTTRDHLVSASSQYEMASLIATSRIFEVHSRWGHLVAAFPGEFVTQFVEASRDAARRAGLLTAQGQPRLRRGSSTVGGRALPTRSGLGQN